MSDNELASPSELLNQAPHRRRNLLTDEWVLVSPHRAQRPWQGRKEDARTQVRAAHEPDCYLCPGNQRAAGERNPAYESVFAFDNDFPALLSGTPKHASEDDLLCGQTESGVCRVICFSPRHDLTISGMSVAAVTEVVRLWQQESQQLGARPEVSCVQIFENKGELMGCSNPHPHGQIWATSSIPNEVAKEHEQQQRWWKHHHHPLLLDYLERERSANERLIYENEDFTILVPWWAVWPFETLILPHRHVPSFAHLTGQELHNLAEAYRTISRIYDKVFDCDFPYSAGVHQAPSDECDHPAWQMHVHLFPPLLRSATIRKFMVGFEMLASPQRDITAEDAAQFLRKALIRLNA